MEISQKLYNPVHSEEWLLKYLNKNYFKKPYDRFMWWRSYSPKTKPLHKRNALIDKIKNGDYEMGSFSFEIQLVEHKLNKTYSEVYPDMAMYLEKESMNLARRKRLLEDYGKDEKAKLEAIYKDFQEAFRITKSQIDDDFDQEGFDSLIDYYYYCEKKYNKKLFNR